MHRFYLPPEQCQSSELTLTGREAHHALDVLREKPGKRVVVLDGAGHELLCEVNETAGRQVRVAVKQKTFIPPLPFQITLIQAIPKGKSFETIIQKATELGVHRIVPLLSERVVTHLHDGDAPEKLEKWRQFTIEAIKQCGSAWLPQIEPPVTPQQWLARREQFELPLIASLQDDRRHPREHFRAFVAEHGRMPLTICIWIGPEGDFTPGEVAAIKTGGALPISLGRLVLRSETAAIYCLSILNYEQQCPPAEVRIPRSVTQ